MDSSAQTPTVDDLLAHVGWVQALARSLVRDASTADDLAQETWMAAMSGARATNESPRGWLGRVLRNRLLQRVRGERARSGHELAKVGPTELPSSDELLERIEQQRVLAEALAATGGNISRVARRLGLARSTLRYRLKHHELESLIPSD